MPVRGVERVRVNHRNAVHIVHMQKCRVPRLIHHEEYQQAHGIYSRPGSLKLSHSSRPLRLRVQRYIKSGKRRYRHEFTPFCA